MVFKWDGIYETLLWQLVAAHGVFLWEIKCIVLTRSAANTVLMVVGKSSLAHNALVGGCEKKIVF